VAKPVEAQEPGSLKAKCLRRLEGLKQNRFPFEGDWRQIASLAAPSRSRFLSSDTNKGRQPNRRLNNGHGIFAMGTLQGGMTSGLSSQSRPWFTVKSVDDDLDENPEVRNYLSICEKRMYAFLAQTNVYGVLKTGYLELGAFGTEAAILMENRKVGMVGHALTAGEYWIGLNDEMVAGSLYRECPLTVIQAVQMFGLENVSVRVKGYYDASNYDQQIIFYHAIEENDEYEEGLLGWRGKPWRSLYWEDQSGAQGALAQLQGFEEQPFWAPRWDTTGNDVWGQGPGHDALPDLRELQLQAKRKAEATDMAVWPEKVVSGKVKLKNQPKSVVSVAAADVDLTKMVMIPHKVDYNTILAIKDDMEVTKQAINEATFADLFMAITNMNGVQPRNVEEIAARNEEKLTQLGPVIERVNNEKLEGRGRAHHRDHAAGGNVAPCPSGPARGAGHQDRVHLHPDPDAAHGRPRPDRARVRLHRQRCGHVPGSTPQDRRDGDDRRILGARWRSGQDPAPDRGRAGRRNQQMATAAEQASNVSKPFKDMTDAAKVASEIPGSGVPPVQDLIPVVPR
jgi:hypothetical protein